MTKDELIALAEVEEALANHFLKQGTGNTTREMDSVVNYESYLVRENMRRYAETLTRANALRALAEGMNDD